MLRQEQEVKSQVMSEKLKSIASQIETLSSTMGDIQAALAAEDLPFLLVFLHNIINISALLMCNSCTASKLQMFTDQFQLLG